MATSSLGVFGKSFERWTLRVLVGAPRSWYRGEELYNSKEYRRVAGGSKAVFGGVLERQEASGAPELGRVRNVQRGPDCRETPSTHRTAC